MKNTVLLIITSLLFQCSSFGQNADTYINQGIAKAKAEDYSGAIADYTKAIELDPESATAYGLRGREKCSLEDYNGAIADMNKAIVINPKSSTFYYTRGLAKELSKNYTGAIADYNKAIEIESFGQYYDARGDAKLDLEDNR